MTDQFSTESNVSPYTGRPISEWLDEDIELHDSDGDEIGDIVEINPDFIVVQTSSGFLGLGEARYYYVPRSYVAREDGDDWYLSIGKDELESMNWQQPPTESAWSNDWNEGRATEDLGGRGQTRLRRYEEDVEASTVEREAGEVVVQKRVVEDTKTVEVPVRREEVHVERRPVTDQTTVGASAASDAFSNETITVPVMEEDVEIRKVARPVEEIEVTKSATQDTRTVDTTVRREEFDIDDQTRTR